MMTAQRKIPQSTVLPDQSTAAVTDNIEEAMQSVTGLARRVSVGEPSEEDKGGIATSDTPHRAMTSRKESADKKTETRYDAYTGSQTEGLSRVLSLKQSPDRKVEQSFPRRCLHPQYAVREKRVQGEKICHVYRYQRDSSACRSFALSRLWNWRICSSS